MTDPVVTQDDLEVDCNQRARKALADAFDELGPTGYARHIRSGLAESDKGWFWTKPALRALNSAVEQVRIQARLEGERAGMEKAAGMLDQAIADGYPAPLNKVDQCAHGKFGWEDCIACYDEKLTELAAAIRNTGATK